MLNNTKEILTLTSVLALCDESAQLRRRRCSILAAEVFIFGRRIQESKEAARKKAKDIVEQLRAMKLKEAAQKVEDGIEEP